MTTTIDRVRSAVRTEPVRRLIGSAPSADELRTSISEGLDALLESAPSTDEVRSAISDGLDALGESLGTVAERVDRSADAVRERVPLRDLPFRPKPARTGPSRPLVVLAGAAVVLSVGFLLGRMDRLAWTTLRDRALKVVTRTSHRAGAYGRHLANQARGTAAVGTQAISSTPPVTDEVLEERVRSALGRAKGLHAIKIEADDGVVRVEGRVDPGEREPALAMLRAVPGVRGVDDRLVIEPGEPRDATNGRGAMAPVDEIGASDRGLKSPDELTTGPTQRP